MTNWLEADTRPIIYMSMGSIYQVPESVLNMCSQVLSLIRSKGQKGYVKGFRHAPTACCMEEKR